MSEEFWGGDADEKHELESKSCLDVELWAIVNGSRKPLCKCHFLSFHSDWPAATKEEKKWREKILSSACLPFFTPSLRSFTLSRVSAGEFSPPDPRPRDPVTPHRVPQPVPPGLPQQAVPAVVEAVGAGELVAGVPGVSSLSADHRQERQPAQIHLRDGECLQKISLAVYLNEHFPLFCTHTWGDQHFAD